MGEESLVDWLRRQAGRETLIGDDTAALPLMRGLAVVTVDQQIEGVHFPAGLDAAIVARRLLAVNLSDLAASGANPRHGFLALAAPPGFDHRRFFRAFLAAAKRQHVSLGGGDLASSTVLHTSLTLVGEKRPGDATLARDRARPGHRIWVGGTLGESALGRQLVARGARPRGRGIELPSSLSVKGGLRAAAVRAVWRHLEPSPQLALGQWLAALGPRGAGAVIDLSDGLAKDLHRICAESGAGANLEAAALAQATPLFFTELCRTLNEEPAALVESGGEDYVLLFTLPNRVSPPPRFGCRAIGVVTREPGVVVIDSSSRRRLLPPRGWDHLDR
jgi:thiamine-monophosphate kinase